MTKIVKGEKSTLGQLHRAKQHNSKMKKHHRKKKNIVTVLSVLGIKNNSSIILQNGSLLIFIF